MRVRQFTCWASFVIVGLASMSAEAAWPTRSRGYQPATRHYVVIEPAPAATTSHGAAGATTDVGWREQQATVPAYPWGWFGARPQPQHQTHHGYYGNYRDRMLRW